jgi:pSer/pThr/pTyr-binding forkhead associated (FHA) protein
MLISQAQPSAVFAWLAIVESPDRNAIGRVHSLQPGTTTLGRVQGNSIVISDDTCSAQHARIRIEEREEQEPAFVLYDLGSSNGTFVGDRETHKDPESQTYRHELQDGDYMLIGETTLVFKRI